MDWQHAGALSGLTAQVRVHLDVEESMRRIRNPAQWPVVHGVSALARWKAVLLRLLHPAGAGRRPDGTVETIAEVPARPSGLGFLPDGRMLIVSMRDRKIMRRELDSSLVEHADLSALAPWHLNDMLVDHKGEPGWAISDLI